MKKWYLSYIFLALLGAAIMRFYNSNFYSAFSFDSFLNDFYTQFAIVCFCVLIIMSLSKLFEKYFLGYKDSKKQMIDLLGHITFSGSALLAAFSAVAEEMFFRGALVPIIGIWGSSLLFAIMHRGADGRLNSWTIWAFIVGVVLAYIFQSYNNLIVVILIHLLNNFIAFQIIRKEYQLQEVKC